MFQRLLQEIDANIAENIFKAGLQVQQKRIPQSQAIELGKKEIGRNDPCWCGSGKKFKKCHGKI